MFHVVYVSTATENLSPSQLRELLIVARHRNYSLGLTGLLLYAHERFIQVLEGPETEVRKVFEMIKKDYRHKNLDTLRLEKKEYRDFPDWRMGFRNFAISLETLPVVSRFLEPEFDTSVFQDESSEAYRMLLAYRDAIDV